MCTVTVWSRKGQYFKVDLFTEDTSGSTSLLSRQEIHVQLARICDMADQWHKGSGSLGHQGADRAMAAHTQYAYIISQYLSK